MTFLLLRVSGVALLERSLVRTRPAYRDYIERTSAFFPRPPRREDAMNPEITFLHDGECPLCAREVAMLRRLDRGRGRLAFDDIAAPVSTRPATAARSTS